MIGKLTHFIRTHRPTLKLAATYLIVIMVMSIVFSLILYFTSIRSLERRQAPPSNIVRQDPDHELDEWLGHRDADSRNALAIRLVLLNAATLLVGACLSYFLARKTLEPIEQAMREQERFIADASHELRTPIASILLSNEVMLRKKDLGVADARQLIQQNVDDINELKNLSDELLDISSDGNTPTFKQQDLQPIIKHALKKAKPLAQAKHSEITVEDSDTRVSTDKALVHKIIMILLDNAIKYSPEKTIVKISVKQDSHRLGIIVSDTGPGIAANDLDHIFERFYRVDTSRSQTSGHGLGLAIAAKLAAKLRGELQVKSTLGQGSQFTLWLPL